ncbi:MAG TPA: glutamate--tRNA ligase family protein [Terracidiphilus sp.]|jgi:glutamyl-tRNA synthetase|nr:glutamate--tRNA ligase family protein [Terracidiphilus sp.]
MASLAPTPTSNYRGRIAPSPTGYLHVGHARTFWTAWQRARDAGGALVMRMEDLDSDRSRSAYAEAAMDDLRWLGIRWLEGPDKGGPFAPYVQSRRRTFYLAAWRRLLRLGYLFPCRCSRRDLATALGAPHESMQSQGAGKGEALDDEPVYPGTCRPGTCRPETSGPFQGAASQLSGPASGEPDVPDGCNWRFRVPDGEAIEFVDGRLGPQRFVAGVDFGDFLVWRRDGGPSYQLACVADDSAMGITEVVRGADLLKSTARQILLNRALGLRDPFWYHCPLVVDHNGRRLAKRHDVLSLRTLRQRGLTPMNILSAELPVAV